MHHAVIGCNPTGCLIVTPDEIVMMTSQVIKPTVASLALLTAKDPHAAAQVASVHANCRTMRPMQQCSFSPGSAPALAGVVFQVGAEAVHGVRAQEIGPAGPGGPALNDQLRAQSGLAVPGPEELGHG